MEQKDKDLPSIITVRARDTLGTVPASQVNFISNLCSD